MFKFRLDRLLKLKLSQENQVKLQLAAVRMKIRDLQDQITSAEDLLRDLYKSMLQNSSRGVMGMQITQWLMYIDAEKMWVKKLYQELNLLKEQEENLKDQYMAARRDRKILENLRTRRFKRYVFDQDRLNRLYLDEVALRKVSRGEG
ncbi:MAG TPA: flagellar export protein FliJ [Pseudothermotoga sp.]|nr:flagellar export protein FliJ [Pseudothermotoga sp.]HOK83411.1 flagellar export protein FliJ [Pseudothermotoga sp.]HPP69484.1 flagellar export protein FliJ [Pseudothermotoga sp.]